MRSLERVSAFWKEDEAQPSLLGRSWRASSGGAQARASTLGKERIHFPRASARYHSLPLTDSKCLLLIYSLSEFRFMTGSDASR